jgi:hypothetical protein
MLATVFGGACPREKAGRNSHGSPREGPSDALFPARKGAGWTSFYVSFQVQERARVIIKTVRTPAGNECKYYYQDYFRGRETRECRLLAPAQAHEWRPSVCFSCPVPGIQLANACPHLVLAGQVRREWFGLSRRMRLNAHCNLTAQPVSEPQIGCGQCHLHLTDLRLPPENPNDLRGPF